MPDASTSPAAGTTSANTFHVTYTGRNPKSQQRHRDAAQSSTGASSRAPSSATRWNSAVLLQRTARSWIARRRSTQLLGLLHLLDADKTSSMSASSAMWHQLLTLYQPLNSAPRTDQHREWHLRQALVACLVRGAQAYEEALHHENTIRSVMLEELASTSTVWQQASAAAQAELRLSHPSLYRCAVLPHRQFEEVYRELADGVREVLEEHSTATTEAERRQQEEEGVLLAGHQQALQQLCRDVLEDAFGKREVQWLLRDLLQGKKRQLTRHRKAGSTASAFFDVVLLSLTAAVREGSITPLPFPKEASSSSKEQRTQTLAAVRAKESTTPSDGKEVAGQRSEEGEDEEVDQILREMEAGDEEGQVESDEVFYRRQRERHEQVRAEFAARLHVALQDGKQKNASGEPEAPSSLRHRSTEEERGMAEGYSTFGTVSFMIPFSKASSQSDDPLSASAGGASSSPSSPQQGGKGSSVCCVICELPGEVHEQQTEGLKSEVEESSGLVEDPPHRHASRDDDERLVRCHGCSHYVHTLCCVSPLSTPSQHFCSRHCSLQTKG